MVESLAAARLGFPIEEGEEPFDVAAAKPFNALGWCDRHGGNAAALPGIAGAPVGQGVYAQPHFGAEEHLNLGLSVQSALNVWARAGLIDGGAMISMPKESNGVPKRIDTWDLKLPDPSTPDAPYGASAATTRHEWHYIVPDARIDPKTQQRWTAAGLRAALERGDAAVLTFGQLVFVAGDLVGRFEDLHKPNLYARPRSLMEAVEARRPLALEVLVNLLHPPSSDSAKWSAKGELEEAREGKKYASETAPQLTHVRFGFKRLMEPTPFGALQLVALLTAAKGAVPWPQVEALAPWFKPGKIDIDRLRKEKLSTEFLSVILTNGLYFELAFDNIAHFAPDNWNTFDEGFLDAATRIERHLAGAASSAIGPIPAEAVARLGFASHFLTDAFSAGHMRVPRAKLGRKGGMLAKVMHDIDGELGLTVSNGFGERWRAYGDGDLEGPDADSPGSRIHKLFEKRVGANFNTLPTANVHMVLTAINEAVALLHYEAQGRRDAAGSATQKAILDKARLANGEYLGEDVLRLRHARLGAPAEWLTRDAAAKIAYLRKHRPQPLGVGTTMDLNHPPLLDASLRPNADVYSRDSKWPGDRQYVVMIWRGLVDTFNITELYLISRLGRGAAMPGIPEDISLLDALGHLKHLSLNETSKRVAKNQHRLVPAQAAQAAEHVRVVYQPASTYQPVIDATLFHCAPSPPGVLPASLCPSAARDADAETRHALRAVGLTEAQLAEFDGNGGVAALLPIGRVFGAAAFAALLGRLRYAPAQLRKPPHSYENIRKSLGITAQQALAPRVLVAIPGYFRELARRAPNAGEAFALENAGWLVADALRNALRDARGVWWLPPAPSWVTPFANPTPGLSADVQGIISSVLGARRAVTLAQYEAQRDVWRNGLPGRLWARETGQTPGIGGAGRAWYADLVPTTAVNIAAERTVINQAWTRFRDGVEQKNGKLTDASTAILAGSCHDGVVPTSYQNSEGRNVSLFNNAALGGLQWTLKFPLREPAGASSDLRSRTKVLAALESTTERLMATMAELGWNDLVFHTAGAFCVRGRRRSSATPEQRRELARKLSNHGSATAIDLNVFENPATGTQTTFDARVVALFESFNFRWGRCFSDPHHFEYS